ncbi:MAG: hypothetical protein ACR2RD_00630 [Woeseiaceae bacterium]
MYEVQSTSAGQSGTATQRVPSAKRGGDSSWYAQLATAWGAALDRQADKTAALAQQLADGNDEPAAALQVSAAAHQLAFISTAAATASNSIGQALESLGRKQ